MNRRPKPIRTSRFYKNFFTFIGDLYPSFPPRKEDDQIFMLFGLLDGYLCKKIYCKTWIKWTSPPIILLEFCLQSFNRGETMLKPKISPHSLTVSHHVNNDISFRIFIIIIIIVMSFQSFIQFEPPTHNVWKKLCWICNCLGIH